MSKRTHYQVLGVQPDAEDLVIKAAYRALAQRYHPDKWDGLETEAQQRMAEINAAYAVLSDADKRREYDAELKSSEDTTSAPKQGPTDFYSEGSQQPIRESRKFADYFKRFKWHILIGVALTITIIIGQYFFTQLLIRNLLISLFHCLAQKN
jgi:DnaJ-class molecular chaperone